MSNERFNHLGLHIKTTKELAKSRNFISSESDDNIESNSELKKGNGKRKVKNHFNF